MRPAFSVGSNVKPSAARKELKSSSLSLPSVNFERKGSGLSGDQYAVMMSCRCNYTGRSPLLWFVAMFVSLLCLDLLRFLQWFFHFLVGFRIKAVFQTTDKVETTSFQGPDDLCCF